MIAKTVTLVKNKTVEIKIDKTVFESNDGKEFDTEKECIFHEKRMAKIRIGRTLFNELNQLTVEQIQSILRLCFDCYGNIDDSKLVIYKPQKATLIEAYDYLSALYFNEIYSSTLSELDENITYVIATWTDDPGSDYPSYHGKTLPLDEVLQKINELQTCLTK